MEDHNDNNDHDNNKSTLLLKAIYEAQLKALNFNNGAIEGHNNETNDPTSLFDDLLRETLELMDCSYGLFGELRYRETTSVHAEQHTGSTTTEATSTFPTPRVSSTALTTGNIDSTNTIYQQITPQQPLTFVHMISHDFTHSSHPKLIPYLHARAVAFKEEELEEKEDFNQLLEVCKANNFEFSNMQGIFGRCVVHKQVVIINSFHPSMVPHGHPPLKSFMGIPLMKSSSTHPGEKEVVGMVAIANKKGGFDEKRDIEFLAPFIATCTNLIISNQNLRRRREAEERLQNAYRNLEQMVEERTMELQQEIIRRKEIEQALLIEKQRAEDAVVQKNAFLANVSHDLRTPLNSIIGISNILSNTTPLTNEQYEYTHLIKVSGNMLINLVSDILDFSRLEMKGGNTVLDMEQFDLRKCVENVIDVSTFKAQERSTIEIVNLYDFESFPQDLVLIGDQFRISTILMNLLSNASKFTLKGTIILRTRFIGVLDGRRSDEQIDLFDINQDNKEQQSNNLIASRRTRKQVRLEFTVEDTGIGMSQEFLSKIGTPFCQVRSKEVDNMSGTGLGLVIVKGMTQVMNGTFDVESQLGVGSKFTITIVVEAIVANPGTVKEYSELQTLVQSKELLQLDKSQIALIADCTRENIESLRDVLRQFGVMSQCSTSILELQHQVQQLLQDGKIFILFIDPRLFSEENISREMVMEKLGVSRDHKCNIVFTTYLARGKHIPGDHRLLKPFKLANVFRVLVNPSLGGDESLHHQETVVDVPQCVHPVSKHRILIVDDNRINQKVLSHILKQLNYLNHDLASSGEEAYRLARKNHYSMIFMDIRMKGMDGFEAARRITEEERKAKGRVTTRIVPLSAHMYNTNDLAMCEQNGMLPVFLSKPVSLTAIENFLDQYLKEEEEE